MKTSPIQKVQQLFLSPIIPIICSGLVGFLFYQFEIFNPEHHAFQFIWSSVVASVFYYLRMMFKPKESYIGLFVLLLLTLLTTKSTELIYILRDVFYVGSIGATVVLFTKHFREGSRNSFVHVGLMFGGLYALIAVITSKIYVSIMIGLNLWTLGGSYVSYGLYMEAFLGVLIGFTVGAGIALNEKVFGK